MCKASTSEERHMSEVKYFSDYESVQVYHPYNNGGWRRKGRVTYNTKKLYDIVGIRFNAYLGNTYPELNIEDPFLVCPHCETLALKETSDYRRCPILQKVQFNRYVPSSQKGNKEV